MNTNAQKIGIELLLSRYDSAVRAGLKPMLSTLLSERYRICTYTYSRRGAHWRTSRDTMSNWATTTLSIPGESAVYAEHYDIDELGTRQSTTDWDVMHAPEHDADYIDGERVVIEN